MPSLRRPLREGRLPRRVPQHGLPVRVRVRGVGPHVHGVHAEGLRRRDRPRAARGGRDASAAASAPCAPAGRRCRCARSRSSPCYGSREDELGCRNPEFHELPRERASFRVFARRHGRDRELSHRRGARFRRAGARSRRGPSVSAPLSSHVSVIAGRPGTRGGRGTSRGRRRSGRGRRARDGRGSSRAASAESLTWSPRTRSSPIRASSRRAASSSAAGSETSTPDAHQWHESRQSPSRGCRSSASQSAASSSIERPIVPPAPAAFSMQSQRSSVVSSRSSRSAGATTLDAPRRSRSRGASRRGRRPPRRRSPRAVSIVARSAASDFVADLVVPAREVHEVEGVARARRLTRGLLAALRGSARSPRACAPSAATCAGSA